LEIIRAEKVSYTYKTKYQTTQAVREVTCSFEVGKMYAITGKSGSGKSTFLSLLAGLDLPTSGNLYVNGEDISTIDRDKYRMNQAAVVYQAFHLFPLLTALENVMFPMELKKISKKIAKREAGNLLQKVGLSEEIFNKFHEDGFVVIVVTHNEKVAKESDTILEMLDGELSEVRKC
jgi:putative ABC transport system ATP-binding protein